MTIGWRDLLDISGIMFGTFTGGPVLANVAAKQRDVVQTFCVDVGFNAWDSVFTGNPEALIVEWSLGTAIAPGTWHLAMAQPFDRLHTVLDPPALPALPGTTPGTAFNFVWDAFQDLPLGTFLFVWVRVTITDTANLFARTVVGPIVVSTVQNALPDPLAAQLARRATAARVPQDFLGNGLDLPFRRGPSDFVSVSGVDLVRARVRQILSTRAAYGNLIGELPWRPDFGQKIWTLRHRNNDRVLRARASAFARDALRWEKSVRVTAVDVERDVSRQPNLVRIHVTYEVLDQDLFGGSVLPPPIFSDELTIPA